MLKAHFSSFLTLTLTLTGELGIQLKDLELERKEDHKIVKLHPFEVASLANLIKAVSWHADMSIFIFYFSIFLF